jgi:hypothetical protein
VPETERPPQTRPEEAAPAPAEPQPSEQEALGRERGAAVGGETVALSSTVLGDFPGVTMVCQIVPVTIIVNGVPTQVFVLKCVNVPPPLAFPTLTKIPLVIHSFKVADDQSPMPQDRVYVDFNYFNNVLGSTNFRLNGAIGAVDVYRETFGLEKTFWDGRASIGLRLPLNTLDVDDGIVPGVGGSNTDLGDLSVIFKYGLWYDEVTQNMLSGGLAVTAPTGPSTFAGFQAPGAVVHDTVLSPFIGYRFNFDKLYLQGFLSLNVATDGKDVTLLFNDVQLGYHLFQARGDKDLLTSLAPVLEAHVNDPLDHRGTFNGPFGTTDSVNLTAGISALFRKRAQLTLGVVTPVLAPRPFDIEALAQLNLRF